MAIPKRMMIRELRLVCATFILLAFIFQSFVYLRPSPDDSKLYKLLQTWQVSQKRNTDLVLRVVNISFFDDPAKIQNTTPSDDIAKDQLRKETRNWFDLRPIAASSKIDISGHPFFPGYVIENPDVCKEEPVDILIYVHSAAVDREMRRNIREGWANTRTFSDITMRLIFILGVPDTDMAQRHIESEYSTYGDIVQAKFADTFRNLTYKAMTMLAWVNAHCRQAKYIVKADDDTFVDIYRVVSDVISKLAPKHFAAACDYKEKMPVPRDPSAKWFVNKTLLAGRDLWPPFCSGYFVVFTGNTIPRLYDASFLIKEFIPIDDAYLFGLLVEKNVSLEFVNIGHLLSAFERPDPDKEINIYGKFDKIAFRVKLPSDHTKLITYRGNKLTQWDKTQSNILQMFSQLEKKAIVLV